MEIVNPPELGRPRGFSHGIVTPPGARIVFVAGQTAADEAGRVAGSDFVAQFDRALDKVLRVVRRAGGDSAQIARMTVYVTDMGAYRTSRSRLAAVWKEHMGAHYPAMALLEVSALVDEGALVEIQAEAVLP